MYVVVLKRLARSRQEISILRIAITVALVIIWSMSFSAIFVLPFILTLSAPTFPSISIIILKNITFVPLLRVLQTFFRQSLGTLGSNVFCELLALKVDSETCTSMWAVPSYVPEVIAVKTLGRCGIHLNICCNCCCLSFCFFRLVSYALNL